jgi:hypothetical protein
MSGITFKVFRSAIGYTLFKRRLPFGHDTNVLRLPISGKRQPFTSDRSAKIAESLNTATEAITP